jgi:hypothetical protein
MIVFAAQAREQTWLEDVHKKYNTLYQQLGADNNELEILTFNSDDLKEIKKTLKKERH